MAVVVKYADNILKGFATSVSIVVCSAASPLLLHDSPPVAGWTFFVGVTMVVAATFMYGHSSSFSAKGEEGDFKKKAKLPI